MIDVTGMEAWSRQLRDSEYEGWVAYVDGAPIFEEVRIPVGAHQLSPLAQGVTYRAGGRHTMEWKMLPHEHVERVELYIPGVGYREDSLVMRMDREPGAARVRFLQMKVAGVQMEISKATRAFGRDEIPSGGPVRTGVLAYRMGVWNPDVPEAVLYEFSRRGHRLIGKVRDPWAPRDQGGWGLNRMAFGL